MRDAGCAPHLATPTDTLLHGRPSAPRGSRDSPGYPAAKGLPAPGQPQWEGQAPASTDGRSGEVPLGMWVGSGSLWGWVLAAAVLEGATWHKTSWRAPLSP